MKQLTVNTDSMKILWSVKNEVKRMIKWAIDKGKMFANGKMKRKKWNTIYKRTVTQNTQKTRKKMKSWFFKMSNRPEQLIAEVLQMASKHTERCSVSYIIRKLKIKTTMKYYIFVVAKIQKTDTTKYQFVEQWKITLIAVGNAKNCNHLTFSNKIKYTFTIWFNKYALWYLLIWWEY